MSKLGIGTSISKASAYRPSIIRDNIVLKHDYSGGEITPISDGAAVFDGTDDYIQLPSSFVHSKITVSAWIFCNADTVDHKNFFENRDDADTGILFYVSSDETLSVKCQGSNVTGTAGLCLNQWVHACFTYDSSNPGSKGIKLYENGVLVGTGSEGEAADWSTTARIGKGNVSNYWFPGYICNVGVWSDVLTEAQIKSIMRKNYARLSDNDKTNLVSWWNLDSAIGETTATEGDSDSSSFSSFSLDNHGYSLGPEKVSNFGFEDSSQTDYTTSLCDYSYIKGASGLEIKTTGTATILTNQHVTIPFNDGTMTAGKYYLVSFDILSTNSLTGAGIIFNHTGGVSTIDIDKGALRSHYWYPSTVGTHKSVVTVTSSGTATILLHAGLNPGNVTVFDNLSVKEILGNTASLNVKTGA